MREIDVSMLCTVQEWIQCAALQMSQCSACMQMRQCTKHTHLGGAHADAVLGVGGAGDGDLACKANRGGGGEYGGDAVARHRQHRRSQLLPCKTIPCSNANRGTLRALITASVHAAPPADTPLAAL